MTIDINSRAPARASSLRVALLAMAGSAAVAAFLLVPPTKGPPAIGLGVASLVAGLVLGTGIASLLRRIDPAPVRIQRRRSIATVAATVLLVASAAALINASRLTDTGLGVELPILAVSAEGKVTTIGTDAGRDGPMIVTPRSGPGALVGGCVWLAIERGWLGAGLFEVAETRACSPRRGVHRQGSAPALTMPPGGEKTDWRWAG